MLDLKPEMLTHFNDIPNPVWALWVPRGLVEGYPEGWGRIVTQSLKYHRNLEVPKRACWERVVQRGRQPRTQGKT
jgi:hypothetical protein